MTVEAFRIPIINFFIERDSSYIQLSGKETVLTDTYGFNPEDPLAGVLSDEFKLEYISNAWQAGQLAANYCNGLGAEVYFSIDPADGALQVDTETSEVTQFQLIGNDAFLSIEQDDIRLTWLDGSISRIFTLCTTNIPVETVLSYGENIAILFD